MSLSKESAMELLKVVLLSSDNKTEPNAPYEVGKKYLIRTVTMTQTGRLTAVYNNELVLEDAAWIADTGRFNECFKDPSVLKEVEPVSGKVIVGRNAIIDVFEWNHDLPREVK